MSDREPQSPSTNGGPQLPLTVRIREACRLTGIGRSKPYELIAAGDIDIIKVGNIALIPMASLQRFLDLKRITSTRRF